MNIEKMREEFESWCCARAMMKAVNPDGSYVYERTQVQWEAWQASRESLVISIPVFDDYPASIDAEMRESLRDAIHAAGVKTK